MANRKKVAVVHAIIELFKAKRSQRGIAQDLGIDRGTVSRHIRLWREEQANPAISTAGNADDPDPNPAIATLGNPAGGPLAEGSNPAISTPGRQSFCEPHRDRIGHGLEGGLSAQRIYQDLVLKTDFAGSYQSVKRFVAKLRKNDPQRFERIESLPGEEAQVDFGSAPRIPTGDGHWRKTWFFRIVLCHSRKGYTEAVHRQDTETFIRCLENAFRYFGGVPAMLITDNLKAAVNGVVASR